MPHSRLIDANGVLITTLQGVVTIREIAELVAETHNYINDGEILELVLHSDDVEIALSGIESVIAADTLKNSLKMVRRGAMAFVSNKDFVYGICRQLQMRVENEFLQICVFRTEETARAWLNEMQSSNNGIEQTPGKETTGISP